MTASNNGFKVIGTTPIRHDAMDQVTGQARYGVGCGAPTPTPRSSRSTPLKPWLCPASKQW